MPDTIGALEIGEKLLPKINNAAHVIEGDRTASAFLADVYGTAREGSQTMAPTWKITRLPDDGVLLWAPDGKAFISGIIGGKPVIEGLNKDLADAFRDPPTRSTGVPAVMGMDNSGFAIPGA